MGNIGIMGNCATGLVLIVVTLTVVSCKPPGSDLVQPVTIAFIGDQGRGSKARAVLQLIKDEGANLVLHQGDLDYQGKPIAWDAFITEVLGADFPYLASRGNHDINWQAPNGYQDQLQKRLDRVDELTCSGDLGLESVCTFRGLFFILSGIGTEIAKDDPEHIGYIRSQLARNNSNWSICSWHKNQKLMQVGGKGDEVGWEAYKACRKGGAIVATGHEHSYSRTHLMNNFETQSIASTSNTLVINKGTSFAFVSGLGGYGIRRQRRRNEPWWASIYTYDQEANFGALFCTFFVNSEPNRASCYFKDIDGDIPDKFELISKVNSP